jgi:hypothetical protein
LALSVAAGPIDWRSAPEGEHGGTEEICFTTIQGEGQIEEGEAAGEDEESESTQAESRPQEGGRAAPEAGTSRKPPGAPGGGG